ncbi:GntR family transcriptional regulator [Rathayibacter soli]|uniref:GntR family transcriptional regulator n=1 Tax=Rathayibacter soli TaxID=3144168 RepID=UPI0027E3D067|nr:GntR family transcriptional regulator [Glaciibacter superstes]
MQVRSEFLQNAGTDRAPESKSVFIARMLRRGILDGEYAEGENLRQRDIAAHFGVSSTPVREALSQLLAEGYIEAKLNHGARVRPLAERMSENWRLRAALESVAAELAVSQVTPEAIQHLRQMAAEFSEAPESRHGELNQKFHFAIYELSDSPVLMRFLTELWQTLDMAPTSRRAHEASAAEHDLIINALERGDGRAAGEYTRLHIEGTRPLDY